MAKPRASGGPLARPRSSSFGPRGCGELQLYQIKTCHGLGDGVLNLNSGIGLDEDERLPILGVEQKLNGCEPLDLSSPSQGRRRRGEALVTRSDRFGAGATSIIF